MNLGIEIDGGTLGSIHDPDCDAITLQRQDVVIPLCGLGYVRVCNLKDGVIDWNDRKLPVER